MPSPYTPKLSYFSDTRYEKLAKGVLEDCVEDRARALDLFSYFQKLVDDNPLDDKAKSELSKALALVQSSNDKAVKILEIMSKLIIAKNSKQPVKTSKITFNDLNG